MKAILEYESKRSPPLSTRRLWRLLTIHFLSAIAGLLILAPMFSTLMFGHGADLVLLSMYIFGMVPSGLLVAALAKTRYFQFRLHMLIAALIVSAIGAFSFLWGFLLSVLLDLLARFGQFVTPYLP